MRRLASLVFGAALLFGGHAFAAPAPVAVVLAPRLPALQADFLHGEFDALNQRVPTFLSIPGAAYAGGITTPGSPMLSTAIDASGKVHTFPTRENAVANSTMVGAAVGTQPTGWSVAANGTGITPAVSGAGTENGFNYVDEHIVGTPSSNGTFFIFPQGTSANSGASQGQSWTASLYDRVSAGSLTNVGTIGFYINENNSGGSFLASGSAAFTPASTMARASYTRTLTNASTAGIYESINVSVTSGQAIDLTLRIYAPMLEPNVTSTDQQVSYPSAFIPTTNAAVFVGTPRITTAGLDAWLASTNYALWSQDLTQTASWTNYWAGPTSRTANAAVAPDGTTTATKLVLASNNTGQPPGVSQSVSAFPTSSTSSVSCWMEGAAGGEAIGFYFDDNAGGGTLSLTTSWKRYNVSGTVGSAGGRVTIRNPSTTVTATIYVWGCQDETALTPYIPTTTASVTRSADIASVSVPGSNWGETIVVKATTPAAYAVANRLWDDGSNSAIYQGALTTITAAGASIGSPSSGPVKVAASMSPAGVTSADVNGSTPSAGSTTQKGPPNYTVYLGNRAAGDRALNSAIQSFVVYSGVKPVKTVSALP